MNLIAPFYKGIVYSNSQISLALITKQDPETGNPISDVKYLELVADSVRDSIELVQDISRASAAALLSVYRKQNSINSRLITVEGCQQIVGGKPMMGADIMASIWTNVIPRNVMSNLPEPIVECTSNCTVCEARAVLNHIPQGGSVQAVTHDYHLARVQGILEEEAIAGQEILDVLTPDQIIKLVGVEQPSYRFISDLVKASTPPSELIKIEAEKERLIYHPLHFISRFGEKLTFGMFNLEMFLARRMRK